MSFVWFSEEKAIITLHNIDTFSYLGPSAFIARYELNLVI
jgi:hypothetical protein